MICGHVRPFPTNDDYLDKVRISLRCDGENAGPVWAVSWGMRASSFVLLTVSKWLPRIVVLADLRSPHVQTAGSLPSFIPCSGCLVIVAVSLYRCVGVTMSRCSCHPVLSWLRGEVITTTSTSTARHKWRWPGAVTAGNRNPMMGTQISGSMIFISRRTGLWTQTLRGGEIASTVKTTAVLPFSKSIWTKLTSTCHRRGCRSCNTAETIIAMFS